MDDVGALKLQCLLQFQAVFVQCKAEEEMVVGLRTLMAGWAIASGNSNYRQLSKCIQPLKDNILYRKSTQIVDPSCKSRHTKVGRRDTLGGKAMCIGCCSRKSQQPPNKHIWFLDFLNAVLSTTEFTVVTCDSVAKVTRLKIQRLCRGTCLWTTDGCIHRGKILRCK
jgi:hypothetical protein